MVYIQYTYCIVSVYMYIYTLDILETYTRV